MPHITNVISGAAYINPLENMIAPIAAPIIKSSTNLSVLPSFVSFRPNKIIHSNPSMKPTRSYQSKKPKHDNYSPSKKPGEMQTLQTKEASTHLNVLLVYTPKTAHNHQSKNTRYTHNTKYTLLVLHLRSLVVYHLRSLHAKSYLILAIQEKMMGIQSFSEPL